MNTKQRQGAIILGVVVIAVIAVGIVIAASGQFNTAAVNFEAITKSRGADGAFILGDPNAPVTIIEFADYACPHCQTYHPEITRFIRDFVETGRAAFEYRSFPTAGGPLTVFTSQIAECIDNERPGAFWLAYKRFYDLAATARYNQDAARIVANDLGLNYTALLSCQPNAQQVNTDIQFAQTYGVSGTPAVMMRIGSGAPQWITHNGVTYNRGPVPYDVLAAVVSRFSS
jgi:protein-disulfide isomerase